MAFRQEIFLASSRKRRSSLGDSKRYHSLIVLLHIDNLVSIVAVGLPMRFLLLGKFFPKRCSCTPQSFHNQAMCPPSELDENLSLSLKVVTRSPSHFSVDAFALIKGLLWDALFFLLYRGVSRGLSPEEVVSFFFLLSRLLSIRTGPSADSHWGAQFIHCGFPPPTFPDDSVLITYRRFFAP